jgi:hypothetical protein
MGRAQEQGTTGDEGTTRRTLRLDDDTWQDWLAVAGRLGLGTGGRAEAIRLLGRAAARAPAHALAALMVGLVEPDRAGHGKDASDGRTP